MSYLWVALGGAIGSVARFWVSGLVTHRVGSLFPWNTLVVNVTGSFIIGVLAVLVGTEGRMQAQTRTIVLQLLMVGVCGGYTTFSSFSLQTLHLIQEGKWMYAGANMLLSVALCMAGVWLGWTAGQAILR